MSEEHFSLRLASATHKADRDRKLLWFYLGADRMEVLADEERAALSIVQGQLKAKKQTYFSLLVSHSIPRQQRPR
jgi:hypothetical protein